jgi:large subunit ribosomal protein L24
VAVKTRIKRGDKVRVIKGHDKGLEGEVIRVLPSDSRIVIQGVNLQKKHQRQVQAGGRTMNPGIIQFEAPVDISNVMLLCPKCNKPTRVGLIREEDKTKRMCKKCQAEFDA